MSIPNGPRIFKQHCLHQLYTDGGFSKTIEYDGKHILLLAKNGNGQVIWLAYATVPDEDCNHMSWFLLMLIRAEYDILNFPTFSDRGHLLAAVRAIYVSYGWEISVKFCVEHIIRNMVHKFKVKGDTLVVVLRRCVMSIQAAGYLVQSSQRYDELASAFLCGPQMALYLLGIDPVHWTIVGNKETTDQDELKKHRLVLLRKYTAVVDGVPFEDVPNEAVLTMMTSPVPSGRPFPTGGESRNNISECCMAKGSPDNGDRVDAFRGQSPPFGFSSFARISLKCIDQAREEYTHLASVNDSPFTNVGIQMSRQCRDCSSDFCVEDRRVIDGIVTYLVCHLTNKLLTYHCTLDGMNSTCECALWTMMRFLCPHLRCSLKYAWAKRCPDMPVEPTFLDYVAPYHLAQPALDVLNEKESIMILPVESDFLSNHATVQDILEPPPRYSNKPLTRSKRRLRSLGELGSGRHASSPMKKKKSRVTARYTFMTRAIKRRKVTQKYAVGLRRPAEAGFFDLLKDLAPVTYSNARAGLDTLLDKPVHRLLHCSECGSALHLVRDCQQYLAGGRSHRPNKEISAGRYLVYLVFGNSKDKTKYLYPEELEAVSSFQKKYEEIHLTPGGNEVSLHINRNLNAYDGDDSIATMGFSKEETTTTALLRSDVARLPKENEERLFVDEEDLDERKPAAMPTTPVSCLFGNEGDDANTESESEEASEERKALLEQDVTIDDGDVGPNETQHKALVISSDSEDDNVVSYHYPAQSVLPIKLPVLPGIQCTVQRASDVYASIHLRHRMFLAKQVFENLIHPEIGSSFLVHAYFADLGRYSTRSPVAMIPRAHRYRSTQHDGLLHGAEPVYQASARRLQHGLDDETCMWLDTTIFGCVQSVINTSFQGDCYMFNSAHANVALRIPTKNGSTSTGVSKKSIEKQTRLMIETGKEISGIMLSERRFWFVPWNKTNCHWTCWLVDTLGKSLIFFNASAPCFPECRKEWQTRNKQTSTMVRLLDIVEQRYRLEDKAFERSEWKAFTYHPTSRSKGVIQTDNYNCGVYVILWIRSVIMRKEVDGSLDFHTPNSVGARCELLHLLQCFSITPGNLRRK